MDPFNERVVSKDGDHDVQHDVERVLVPGPPVKDSWAGESDSDSTFGSCTKSQHNVDEYLQQHNAGECMYNNTWIGSLEGILTTTTTTTTQQHHTKHRSPQQQSNIIPSIEVHVQPTIIPRTAW